jgi:hypothetical protein
VYGDAATDAPPVQGTVVLAAWLQRLGPRDSGDHGGGHDNGGLGAGEGAAVGALGLAAVTFNLTLRPQGVPPKRPPLPAPLPTHSSAVPEAAPDAEAAAAAARRARFSVVVQGPLNAVSLGAVPGYLLLAERVVVRDLPQVALFFCLPILSPHPLLSSFLPSFLPFSLHLRLSSSLPLSLSLSQTHHTHSHQQAPPITHMQHTDHLQAHFGVPPGR